ncbi:phosphonate ABC transporter, permease protein PhnE, partial [Clostridium perfringens]
MSKSWNDIVPQPKKSRLRWLIYVVLAIVYVWAFSGIPYSGIKETAGQVTKAIFSGLFSP